jgi:26S proteasome non-ATPase regulatory subunit 10
VPDPDIQDVSGWTPLMIAANVKDSDAVVDILLAKGADVNQKSEGAAISLLAWCRPVLTLE